MASRFLEALSKQQSRREKFAVATVVNVYGSASARTGSKAIFNSQGKNIFGWVGGGCAERFVGEQSVEALQFGQTRIVTADLDDEIFGLGIACGGKMDIFIEPVFPEEPVALPKMGAMTEKFQAIAKAFGWSIQWTSAPELLARDFSQGIELYAQGLIRLRQTSGRSLRLVKDLGFEFTEAPVTHGKKIVLVGRSRITEALAVLALQMGWTVEIKAPDVDPSFYPHQVRCDCLTDGYHEIQFQRGDLVIVASHHAQDPQIVKKALEQQCAYVGMIGSRKRALEVIGEIQGLQDRMQALFVPAGLDLDARTPEEIALSILAEILQVSR